MTTDFKAGDRVRHADVAAPEYRGTVLEVRDMGERGTRARVDWDDENIPTWCGVQYLRPIL